MADLKTNLLGFVMNSPVIGASGTVGYGVEYEELADFAKIGGISGKGLTLHGQYGNKGERLWETPSGLIKPHTYAVASFTFFATWNSRRR